MPKMIFVNLPVAYLAAATRFYQAIGCEKNEQFSDDRASSMVWSDAITFHLLTREYFAGFAPKGVADAREACGALYALTHDSRAAVDAVTEAAAAAGGKSDTRGAIDMGWLYNRCFEDTEGNVFEAVWMDMAAASEAMAKSA